MHKFSNGVADDTPTEGEEDQHDKVYYPFVLLDGITSCTGANTWVVVPRGGCQCLGLERLPHLHISSSSSCCLSMSAS